MSQRLSSILAFHSSQYQPVIWTQNTKPAQHEGRAASRVFFITNTRSSTPKWAFDRKLATPPEGHWSARRI